MIHKVEQLAYGGDDEAGGFCEALVINDDTGTHYVLHRGGSFPGEFLHEKIEFDSERELREAFPSTYRRGWASTDAQCGYSQVSPEDFQSASKRRRELLGLL